MGCDCNDTAEAASTGYHGPTQTLNHQDCQGVHIDLLNMFFRILDCIRKYSMYQRAGVSEQEITAALVILTNWIAVKQVDPASCQYQDKLPLIQVLVNKSVAYGQC